MKIEMPRGDLRKVRFIITDKNGNPVNYDFDEIYFTCKKHFTDNDYIFQKSVGAGTITKKDGYYRMTINPSDTEYLRFGMYVFDVEVIYQDSIKQTSVGKLILTNEATHVRNERR